MWDFDYVAWGDLDYSGSIPETFDYTSTPWFTRMREDPTFNELQEAAWPELNTLLNEITKEGGLPVALLPGTVHGYAYHDPKTGERVRLNAKTAALFDTAAVCFYRPLPQKKLGIPDLLLYMKNCVSLSDVLLIVAATLAVTLAGLRAGKRPHRCGRLHDLRVAVRAAAFQREKPHPEPSCCQDLLRRAGVHDDAAFVPPGGLLPQIQPRRIKKPLLLGQSALFHDDEHGHEHWAHFSDFTFVYHADLPLRPGAGDPIGDHRHGDGRLFHRFHADADPDQPQAAGK